jgi:phosphoglycerate dehydrogenase-like enzyme
MKLCVVVPGLTPLQQARLRDALHGHEVAFGGDLSADARRSLVAESEVLFGNVPAAWLVAAPALRWVQLESAGVDAYLGVNAARGDRPLALTHLRGFFDRAVAEATLAGMLAWLRRLPPLLAAQPAARWIKPEVEPGIGMLDGTQGVILGAGSIARRLERLLAAFDARTTLYARSSGPSVVTTESGLAEALARADWVINTLPHTPETIGFMGRERLAQIKRGALFVNVGRGSTVDEAALVAALDAGQLAGAYLDVTAVEPLPVESPLWKHPQVILSQHTGGRFPGETDRKIDVFLANWARFERGEPLQDVVAVQRGY